MQLKQYQKEALKALKTFLEKSRETNDAVASFTETTGNLSLGRYKGKYRSLKDMEQVPYACIRIPTGGGKTILGAYAIKVAGVSYLERDYPVALWLVPSNTIRTQTADALKNPGHPYRQALDDAFDGRVRVFDISEFANIRPTDLSGSACIIVGTIQTLRVKNTEGRKVYSHHEALEPHFSRLSRFPDGLEKDDSGQIKFSFANLLHIHHPLLIVDEAHNAVTGLTNEMQQRINPACIIEFTATPKPRSNVLFSVSASVLKDEEMIKLPIVLTAHKSWQAAVGGAMAERSRLAEVADKEHPYIRPLILFQAQNKDQEVTVEALRKHLIEEENISEEKIAIATGNQRELDGINLFDPKCPIEHIITVQALKEGWDCSFAYVFCSVANVRSKTDVEQLLGRVLRMPYAHKRSQAELNSAYSHICEPDFIDAAVHLKDQLINMGFEAEEAEDNIKISELDLHGGSTEPPAPEPVKITLEIEPDLSSLPGDIQGQVVVDTNEGGGSTITIETPLSEEHEEILLNALTITITEEENPEDKTEEIKKKLAFQRHMSEHRASPAAKGAAFSIPQLCLPIQGELTLAEPGLFLQLAGWDLLEYPAELTPGEFDPSSGHQSFKVDVNKDKVEYETLDTKLPQPGLAGLNAEWDERVLSRWLDRHCRTPDVPQPKLIEFARRVVLDQITKKSIGISLLVQGKYRLAKAITGKINDHRITTRDKGYQDCLFDIEASPEVSFSYAFDFHPDQYPATSYYRGSFQFKKHYYGNHRIGDLKNVGEEFECAQALDMQPEVKFWVRNLDSRPKTSFRFPLANGWFYPDFIALLNDDRVLVLEYKGAHLVTDSAEKVNIGELWESKSGGKGIFLMAENKKDGLGVFEQIKKKINK
ncbi:MAG: DEAD/DEAH box helicase family protein [Sedimenticola sp.]